MGVKIMETEELKALIEAIELFAQKTGICINEPELLLGCITG